MQVKTPSVVFKHL